MHSWLFLAKDNEFQTTSDESRTHIDKLKVSPIVHMNPAGTPGYRNGTESFGFKGCPSVVQDV